MHFSPSAVWRREPQGRKCAANFKERPRAWRPRRWPLADQTARGESVRGESLELRPAGGVRATVHSSAPWSTSWPLAGLLKKKKFCAVPQPGTRASGLDIWPARGGLASDRAAPRCRPPRRPRRTPFDAGFRRPRQTTRWAVVSQCSWNESSRRGSEAASRRQSTGVSRASCATSPPRRK